jgi:hypothetical protein
MGVPLKLLRSDRHSRQRVMLKACLRHDALSGNPAERSTLAFGQSIFTMSLMRIYALL